MAAQQYAFTLTPGGPRGARSFFTIFAAIAGVCVLSSTVVMRELVSAAPARATVASAARTWDLEPRWWPGPIRQVARLASTAADTDLTFTKGYQLRLAARQATQPASVPARLAAGGPSAETQFGRSAIVVHKATTVARNDTAPSPRRPDAPGGPFARFDAPGRALAYDDERSDRRGTVAFRGNQSGNFFGNLY